MSVDGSPNARECTQTAAYLALPRHAVSVVLPAHGSCPYIRDAIETFMPNLLVNSLSITPADVQEEADIATGQNLAGTSESSVYRFPGKGTAEYTAKIRLDYSTNGSTYGQSDFVIINI